MILSYYEVYDNIMIYIHEFSCVASWVARAWARGSVSHGEKSDFSKKEKGCRAVYCVLKCS